jgi:hypothetical protein
MILTVGCSYTYGKELIDRNDAWPYQLAKRLNTQVENLGLNGASNDYIFRTAIESTCQQKYDLVVIQWSEPSRMEVANSNGTIMNFTAYQSIRSLKFPLPETVWIEDYYKNWYNDQFRFVQWLSQIVALQGYFKSQNQRYIFARLGGESGYFKRYHDRIKHLIDNIDQTYFLGWPNLGLTDLQGSHPRLANGHPSEAGHQQLTEKFYEHIGNLGWLS